MSWWSKLTFLVILISPDFMKKMFLERSPSLKRMCPLFLKIVNRFKQIVVSFERGIVAPLKSGIDLRNAVFSFSDFLAWVCTTLAYSLLYIFRTTVSLTA